VARVIVVMVPPVPVKRISIRMAIIIIELLRVEDVERNLGFTLGSRRRLRRRRRRWWRRRWL